MKKILNALFLTIITLVTFSCSDVPAPYDINGGGNGEGPALTGDGTKENPYDIASAMTKQDNSEAWVMGYIVGCINDKSISTDAVFAPPFTNQANILIAADADETDYKKCIPVQLVANTDVRTALNLVNNEGNLGKAVVIKGQLTKYFGVAGLKNPTAAVLDGKDIGDGGDTPSGDLASLLDPSNPVAEVTNTFDDAETDKEYVKEGYVNFAEAGARTWRGKPFNNNGLIQATAYGSKEASVISWFVTPAVNVAQMAVKKVTFDCISAYYKEGTKLEIYFLEKDGTNLKSTLINVGTLPQSADGYSEAVTLSGDLTSVGDKVGFIGFKYIGSETASGTYQIDNLYVGVEPGEGPGPGPDPTGSGTKEDPYDVASVLTLSTATGTQTAWVKGYIVGGVKNGNDANTVDAPEDVVFGLDDIRSSAIIIAGSKDETDYTKCLVIGFGGDSQAAKTALNLVDNPDNLGKEVLLLGTLKYAFGAPGMKTITDHELVTGGGEPEPGKVYTSNIELPTSTTTDANKASGGKVIVEGQEYPILKLGTGSALGFWNSPALTAGASKLSFFAVGWTGKTGQLTVVIENGGTFTGGETSKIIALDGKTAGAAANSPFTITPAETDYYDFTMTGITASSTIKFTTDGAPSDKRAIIFGINIK
ncbi:hypothetical protein C799_04489 [Bacteroides thetaiotaomicron dnLKV9]|uniref:Endonuclease YhcR N-terminal domain-containing protein n=1 Tax=Bacteroides thetaiotaomicron dnLKV9 TaxID=1235785 RepID=R9GYZ8_BACT4|nr:DUF6359 domain-containing protein [Bacteroides thetaiotaomicron]EOR97037.1 hypothetical protein C799_04489 [Bacteroides thetaiotaomicron dnLKV9]MDC2006873.1 DUF6359 domain-containing protein [Bacteroides thetaiotaomicron]MDC2021963.1 DUF6359 domain-containing protein [Bacteroides thetaiotaomicron]MDC2027541.1 DUF6359 domain-containing protein [Bacteroides thetaiotaomicron]MDC2030723.1 DUF6359 domain-containing protein [Bacteroides thetaiotaomicron]